MNSERECEIARLRQLLEVKLACGWSFFYSWDVAHPGRGAIACEYFADAQDYLSALHEVIKKECA